MLQTHSAAPIRASRSKVRWVRAQRRAARHVALCQAKVVAAKLPLGYRDLLKKTEGGLHADRHEPRFGRAL